MSYGIKHQIDASIAANERNIESLRQMRDLYGQLEPSGWTPGIYAAAVAELQRVQMCVLHRSVILDVLALSDEADEYLPDQAFARRVGEDEEDQPAFTRQKLNRLRDALKQSLAGLPPKSAGDGGTERPV
ncbi:hypothetical protein CBF45_07385 [Bordetella sp. J329]|nr:hypothetical protein CBF45_07385 [Bordetella sp. J329]